MLRDVFVRNAKPKTFGSSVPTRPTRIGSRASSRSRTAVSSARRSTIDDHVAADGRVMEVLSEHLCEGWLEGYVLTGRHGMFATYEVVRHGRRVDDDAARQVARGSAALPWRAPVPSLNILLTSTCWRNDHNGFSHQGPGSHRRRCCPKRGIVARDLPAARRELPALGRRPLPSYRATTST